MTRRLKFISYVSALAVACAALAGAPARAIESGATPPVRIGDVLAGSPLWADWFSRFLRPSGRVVDTASKDASHSEGQGYGMLLAVAAGDRAAFERIWRWTRGHLEVRSDHLAAWRWDPETRAVSDRNNATDGDILIAWALAEAADLWNAPKYAKSGAAIARDIGRKLVVDAVGIGPVLLPGDFGFGAGDQPDGPVVNLSYWVFPAFARLAQLAPKTDWDAVRRSGLAIIDAVQSRGTGLPADWTALADGKAAPARHFPPRSGYDALRVPLYLAFSQPSNDRRLASSGRAQFAGDHGLPIVNLETGKADGLAQGRGYRAIAALRDCATTGAAYPSEFYSLSPRDAYYPATLQMLAVIAALTQSSRCLDPVGTQTVQPVGWSPRYASALPVDQPKTAALPGPGGSRSADEPAPPPPRRAAASVHAGLGLPPAAPVIGNYDDDTQQQDRSSSPAGPLGALLLVATVFLLARRRRRSRPGPPIPPAPPLRERSPAPRNLPHNPFGAIRTAGALEERLEIAAKSSRQWERTSAVAYFRLTDYAALERTEGAQAAEGAVRGIVAALANGIRKSDAIAELSRDEVAVCLSLIADEADLQSVGRRLTTALLRARPQEGPSDQIFGLALYPARGGSGAACLEKARCAFCEARSICPNATASARAAKPRRTRAPARRKSAAAAQKAAAQT